MKKIFGNFVIGASMVVSAGILAANPAQAGTISGVTIGGTAASDYYVYGVSGNQTVLLPNTTTNVQNVLNGNATSPTGNVELRVSSEQPGFDFSKNTTLSGNIGGKNITLSSLTLSDWTTTYKNTGKSFGEFWFDQFYNAAGLSSKEGLIKIAFGLPSNTPSASVRTAVFNTFKSIKGLERSSDPNISYVNQDDNSGLIKIGLAGHFNLKTAYSQTGSPFAIFKNLVSDGFQASEVVKYTYNGVTDYLYSFAATNSGLVASDDGISHTGNYEVTIDGVPPAKVPEPSVMLGLFGVAGIVAAQRKLKKVSA
ncbi:NF038130 family PEP-CTERM protein [Anabaena azotica]|uniref:NF038130 family PEP-CTERM protein n=1 Tax=Anabaena azotica TaxID=197653 RepID=UPI0039A67439